MLAPANLHVLASAFRFRCRTPASVHVSDDSHVGGYSCGCRPGADRTDHLLGARPWVLIDWGVLTLANRSLNLWLGILVLSLILGIGLSWSILRQRLSGQASVDEIDG